MAITTSLDQVRLLIGDTVEAQALFSDEEINYFIDQNPDNVHLAAAACCDQLAVRFAREHKFTSDGQSFDRSHAVKFYRDLAVSLRARGSGGIASSTVTRVDGYSQDIPAGQVTYPRRPFGYEDFDTPY